VEIRRINKGSNLYPAALTHRMGEAAPDVIYADGDPAILKYQRMGLICSIRCPGSIVLKTFDLIRTLRDKGVVLIGGFHSPMERECLDLLLRSTQPVILCPAKSIRNLRMGKAARNALNKGRLLILSVFDDAIRRTTAPQSILRNDVVAALAKALLVPHAFKNGKTWATLNKALGYGQDVFTLEDEANADLIRSGARIWQDDRIAELLIGKSGDKLF
jgi:predicted Rossmann fold nucleotide-binding protein DprA/Smf involved in DNA uptake